MTKRQCVEIAMLGTLLISGCTGSASSKPEPKDVVTVAPEPVAFEQPKTQELPPAPVFPERTVWEGVYTAEQGRRGEVLYANACARCHGDHLEGDDVVSELVGEAFLSRWSRKRAGNLFSLMKNEMPPKLAERLDPLEYVDILAYLLSRNDAPPSEVELPSDFVALQAIVLARDE